MNRQNDLDKPVKNHHKGVPIVVVGAVGIEKVPAGRVLDGDFAVWWLAL